MRPTAPLSTRLTARLPGTENWNFDSCARHRQAEETSPGGFDCIFHCICSHNQLPTLANNQVLALELGQMLGDSRARSADQVGQVLVTRRYSQKLAARLFDSKVRGQFKQGNRDAFAKTEKNRIYAEAPGTTVSGRSDETSCRPIRSEVRRYVRNRSSSG